MKKIVSVLALAIGIAIACTSREPEKPAAGDAAGRGDVNLKAALRMYVLEFLRHNPTTNTYLGGAGLEQSLHGVDGRLRDYSPAAIELEDQWLTSMSTLLDRIDPATLSPNARVDRDVALAQIRFMLRQHQVRRYQERALDTYVGEPFRALDWQLQGMTQTGASTYGTADEWNLVVARLRAIPAYLATAQQQLMRGVGSKRTPDRRMLERDGLITTEANAQYFGDTLPKLARERITGADRERLAGDIAAAAKQAADAYRKFRTFLVGTFFNPGTPLRLKPQFDGDRFAFGAEEYDWAIRNNFRLEKTSAQLFDEAWPIVEATRRDMALLACEIATRHQWINERACSITPQQTGPIPEYERAVVRNVFDQLSTDYPKSDAEMVSWYRDAAFRLVEYARKTGLFDVPADYKLEVVETPPPLQASVDGAAYYPAPPFKNSGIGRYYVSPTRNDPAALKSNNRAALADLSAHEGFPGHDWYYKVLTQSRDRVAPVRWLTPGAVEDSSAMWEDSMPSEGWGLYAEALMAEPQPGAPHGFYTPEERLYQLQGQLYRDLRVRIDTGIHTGRLSYDDAVTLYSDVVDFLPGSCSDAAATKNDAKRASCESAERAIFRYSKWPTQAITYRLGKDQIYALRAEAAKRLGATFSAKAFHLQYIKQGTIPAAYFREILLNELSGR